jgi:hypothetical protein
MTIISHLLDVSQGKTTLGESRSPKWPQARKQHLTLHPTCALCGGADKLEVHHIVPFHLAPNLELVPENFITLCESLKGGINCHLAFGHLGNFKSWNVEVVNDTKAWQSKIIQRPIVTE